MKVNLTLELELPEVCNTYSNDELRQILSDAVVNYSCVKHGADATHWIAKGYTDLAEHHTLWADILAQGEWDAQVQKECGANPEVSDGAQSEKT